MRPRHSGAYEPACRPSWQCQPTAPRRASCVEALKVSTQTPAFDVVCGFVTALQAVLVAVEVEYMTSHAERPQFFYYSKCVFACWFVIELGLRLWGAGWKTFLRGADWRWNWVDMILVGLSVLELLDTGEGNGPADSSMAPLASAKSIIRAVRLVRIIRTGRMLQYFHQFSKMTACTASAMKTLFWALLLLGMMIFTFAVSLTQAVTEQAGLLGASERDGESESLLVQAFGNLSRSSYSLYKAVSNGESWGNVMNPLLSELPWPFPALFMLYVTVTLIGVLNVVTSIFIESAMQTTKRFRALRVAEQKQQSSALREHLRTVFEDVDSDHSGCISMEEMEIFLQDRDCSAYLDSLEIGPPQARELFLLLDADQSGTVDLDEFMEACTRLVGTAKSYDMHCILLATENILCKLNKFLPFCEARLNDLADRRQSRWSDVAR